MIDIMTKQACLPTTLKTTKGAAFTSTIFRENPQTLEELERTHASLKTNLKVAFEGYHRQGHKYN